jgi:hypothetical protein
MTQGPPRYVREGISDRLLAWKGIEATLEISKSPNAKVVGDRNSENGLPSIFDSSAASASRWAVSQGATTLAETA